MWLKFGAQRKGHHASPEETLVAQGQAPKPVDLVPLNRIRQHHIPASSTSSIRPHHT